MIERVGAVIAFERVKVPHTNEAWFVRDASGRVWVRKRESEMGPEGLLAEVVGWHVGRALGVSVPDAAISEGPEGRAWLSRMVPNASHWAGQAALAFSGLDQLARIHLLDTLIANEARHMRNLLVEGAELRAIDQEEALVGHVADFVARDLRAPSPHNLARGLPKVPQA
ncbi:MAG: hypothetical protein ACOZNI_27495 [Myxococcota bacterium]